MLDDLRKSPPTHPDTGETVPIVNIDDGTKS